MVQTDNDRDVLERSGQFGTSLSTVGRGRVGHDKTQSAHPLTFSAISSTVALNAAWQKFSRGKKSRIDVHEYSKKRAANICTLHRLLDTGSYRHGVYQAFMICDPKQRQIHKATVQDRIVHQAVVTAIEPLFEKRFIHDSYSCRPGKGTHAGVTRLGHFLRRASRNNTRKVYALKCDVRKYFASIDHEILLQLIERRVHNERILELIRDILLSHGAESGKGIPLGNVTSQLFANIYLHELDWHVKQDLGVRYYARYCDDFVIISHDKQHLESLIKPLRDFLYSVPQLDLHPDKITLRAWDQGVDFLGYVLRPRATTIRTKTRRRMMSRVSARNLSSYLGMCGHADAYCLSQVLRMVAWQRNSSDLV